MEAQVKQQQQQKQKQPQKEQGKQGKPNEGKASKEEKEPVVFERPRPYGWYTVVFPQINSDMDYHMALWLDNALMWVRAAGIKRRKMVKKLHQCFSLKIDTKHSRAYGASAVN
jgi:hypothetical protein